MQSPASGFPRHYFVSRGWKIAFVAMSAPLFVGALMGLWYFGSGHEVTSTGQQIAMLAICAGLAALGGWGLIVPWRRQLTLHAESMDVPGLLRTTTIARRDIAGYRFVRAGHTPTLALQPRAGSGASAKTVTLLFPLDGPLLAWLEPLTDLDDAELAESLKSAESDARLGRDAHERRAAIDRAQRHGRHLTLGAYALMLWLLFYPRPYLPLLLAVAALPWLVLWLCHRWPAAFRITDERGKSVRVDLVTLLFSPGFFLALRALADTHPVAVTDLLVPTAVALAIVMAAILAVEPAHRRPGKAALMATLMVAYAMSLVALANEAFDSGEPQRHSVVIDGMRQTTGKGRRNLLSVEGGPPGLPRELKIGSGFYGRLETGDAVCVLVYPGALGAEWYVVRFAVACEG